MAERLRAGRSRRCAAGIFATALATLALAVPASGQPLYGVVPQDGALPVASDLEMMPPGGIQSIRLMAHWPTVEPTRGLGYDWGVLDSVVREMVAHGIQPYLFFYGTPDWAARNDGHNCQRDCSIYPPSTPETRRAFADFAAAAVKRYGPGGDFWEAPVPPTPAATEPISCPTPDFCPPPPVDNPPPPPTQPPCGCTTPQPIHTWQIWNEQNSPKYFAPSASIETYAAMVRELGGAIKSVDPTAEVVLGGMWGPNTAKNVVVPVKPYLKRLYAIKGIKDSFDSIALHPYSQNVAGSLEQLEDARKILKRKGDRKAGLWITEIGWASVGPKGDPYVKGLQGQARLLARALKAYERKQRHFRLRGVFWYSWRDKAGGEKICSWCGSAGLRASDGSPKPAWRAFTRVATR